MTGPGRLEPTNRGAGPAHEVVIVGGGFGGLDAARALSRAPVRVSLVDRRNFHLFQPLLYQIATGALSPGDIASPLRLVLRRQRNARVLLAEVIGIDPARRRVRLTDGEIPYDTLILAAGARHHYFGHPEWEAIAPGLKTIEDATEMRRRIFVAFEAAERESNPDLRRAWLTFVLVGAGPTGVELAGALGEIAHHTLREDFRTIEPAEAQIILVEGAERVLPLFPAVLSARAAAALARLGVRVETEAMVVDLDEKGVDVRVGDKVERIACRTILWAAGVRASPLATILAEATGCPLDRAGLVLVEPDLSVPGHPEILVIGDMATLIGADRVPLPGVAPVAMQEGRYAADLVRRRAAGQEAPPPFRYRDPGDMATIGRGAAVADFGWLRLSGFGAWLAWLFVHLINLIEFDNRLLVLVQWAWNYLTWNRGARLITGVPAGSTTSPTSTTTPGAPPPAA
jgi:NADH dehydrogenase